MSTKLALQLYFAFIFSRIKYGIEIYGNCSQYLLSKIQTIQNKLLKLLLQLNRRTSTNEIHEKLKILKVKDIQLTNTLCFVNDCLLGKSPEYFHDYYSFKLYVYNIRNPGLHIPRVRTVQGSLSVKIFGAHLWNELPDDIKQHRHKLNFKNMLLVIILNDM